MLSHIWAMLDYGEWIKKFWSGISWSDLTTDSEQTPLTNGLNTLYRSNQVGYPDMPNWTSSKSDILFPKKATEPFVIPSSHVKKDLKFHEELPQGILFLNILLSNGQN